MAGVTYDTGRRARQNETIGACGRSTPPSWQKKSYLRFPRPCWPKPGEEARAKRVGVLAGKAHHDDIVDVAVVEGALRRGDAVVTSNEEHIRRVGLAAGGRLQIETV